MSKNSRKFLGREPEELLGKALLDSASSILTQPSIDSLREAFTVGTRALLLAAYALVGVAATAALTGCCRHSSKSALAGR